MRFLLACFLPASLSIGAEDPCRVKARLIGVTEQDQRVHTRLESGGVASSLVSYRRTNRGYFTADPATKETLQKYYPPRMFADLEGESVADIGAGGGAMIRECAEGRFGKVSRARAVEIHLDEGQVGDPLFVSGEAAATGLESESVTRLFSTLSVFNYDLAHQPVARQYLVASLVEFHRILRKGGLARISPVKHDSFVELLLEVPGLRVLAFEEMPSLSGGVGAIEIIKDF